MMEYGYRYNMMGGRFGFMIICIIVIGVVVFTLYKVLKKNNNSKDIVARDNSIDILNERFARGEINEDEYNQKKNMLMNHKKI